MSKKSDLELLSDLLASELVNIANAAINVTAVNFSMKKFAYGEEFDIRMVDKEEICKLVTLWAKDNKKSSTNPVDIVKKCEEITVAVCMEVAHKCSTK